MAEYGAMLPLCFLKSILFLKNIQKYGFWSINHDSSIKRNLWGKVYDSTYATFFLGTHKGNDIMKACVEFYDAFYKKHTSAIDYFMNDYMLILTMKYHIDNDILRKIPFNDGTPFYLADVLNNKAVLDLTEIKKLP